MSQREFQRVKVIENAVAGRITLTQASELLGLSRRQVYRLKAATGRSTWIGCGMATGSGPNPGVADGGLWLAFSAVNGSTYALLFADRLLVQR